ncbi:MAG: hypothetical protein PVI86_05645 [Phycisphaerae bacterium]|jgi:hypothetical protein
MEGCRIHPGTNHLLLVARSNSGFDADTVPTVVELSLMGRYDGIHAPSFEEAQTPPVVTSLRRQKGLWPPMGAIFAAGPAALGVASGTNAESAGLGRSEEAVAAAVQRCEQLSEIELMQPPKVHHPSQRLFRPGDVPPVSFSTSRSIGVELEFLAPRSPPVLQSVHAGIRRKELLATPLSISEQPNRDRPFVVRTPSVLALVNVPGDENSRHPASAEEGSADRTADDTTAAGTVPKATIESSNANADLDTEQTGRHKLTRIQFFATGRAATRLATDPRVRRVFLEPLVGKNGTAAANATPPETD